MRLTSSAASPAALVLVALLGLAGLTACGGDSDEPDPGASSEAPAGDVGSAAGVDEESEEAPASGPEDICALLTAEEVSTAMGVEGLSVAEVPGGGCNFSNTDDPVQPSVVLNQVPIDDANGGFDGLKSGVTATIVGDSEDLDGVGDAAFVATGTLGGGTATNGGGAVQLGDTGVQVTLIQGVDLAAEDVKQKLVDVLTLIASKA